MERILEAMRASAWERAKAELSCIQQSDYSPEMDLDALKAWDHKCAKRRALIEEFIEKMEEEEIYL